MEDHFFFILLIFFKKSILFLKKSVFFSEKTRIPKHWSEIISEFLFRLDRMRQNE